MTTLNLDFSAMTPAKAKAAALAVFQAACTNESFNDWRGLAALMAQAIAVTPRKRDADGTPAWWVNYRAGRKWSPGILSVTFRDGFQCTVTVHSETGKPFNIGRGLESAFNRYRNHVWRAAGSPEVHTTREAMDCGIMHVDVPPVSSAVGEWADWRHDFDPDDVNRLSEEMRAGPWNLPAERERVACAEIPAEIRAMVPTFAYDGEEDFRGRKARRELSPEEHDAACRVAMLRESYASVWKEVRKPDSWWRTPLELRRYYLEEEERKWQKWSAENLAAEAEAYAAASGPAVTPPADPDPEPVPVTPSEPAPVQAVRKPAGPSILSRVADRLTSGIASSRAAPWGTLRPSPAPCILRVA